MSVVGLLNLASFEPGPLRPVQPRPAPDRACSRDDGWDAETIDELPEHLENATPDTAHGEATCRRASARSPY